MAYRTYAFQDIDLVLSHSDVGQLVISGSGEEKGAGQISLSYANDQTVHDVAADGHVMVSKVHVKNGTMILEVQQVSEAQDFLEKWNNYISSKQTVSSVYSDLNGYLRNASTGETIECIGGAPQRVPDKMFQAQGQRVSWNILFTEINFEGSTT